MPSLAANTNYDPRGALNNGMLIGMSLLNCKGKIYKEIIVCLISVLVNIYVIENYLKLWLCR